MRYNEGERKRRTKGNFRRSVALTGMKKDLEMRRNKTLDPKKTKYKAKKKTIRKTEPPIETNKTAEEKQTKYNNNKRRKREKATRLKINKANEANEGSGNKENAENARESPGPKTEAEQSRGETPAAKSITHTVKIWSNHSGLT